MINAVMSGAGGVRQRSIAAKLSHATATKIGMLEAKRQFFRLLERIAAGEKFVITRHGKSVAQLVPIISESDAPHLRRQAAIVRLKTMGDGNRLERLTIRQLIDEGRQF